ncbi:MAG TPA: hypothetical protein VHC44_02070 [Verrucomicrobiae bacterium]|nr:hypothetical protein [Verrucomicrobiae bacterium]
MNSEELKAIESQRQELLDRLNAAESALRDGLHKHGFGSTAHAHMERALAHVREAYIAINEAKPVRSVQQTHGRFEPHPAGHGERPARPLPTHLIYV